MLSGCGFFGSLLPVSVCQNMGASFPSLPKRRLWTAAVAFKKTPAVIVDVASVGLVGIELQFAPGLDDYAAEVRECQNRTGRLHSRFGRASNDLTARFGVRIPTVFQHTVPGGATWKNSSRKSCHLSKATFDGGMRRRNTWKNLQVAYPRWNRRNGNC